MSGYSGFSMSNNAVKAYKSGKLPLSKINKDVFEEAKAEYLYECELENTCFSKEEAAKMLDGKTLAEFKAYLKTCKPSEWHHSSKFYNSTNFYDVANLIEDFIGENI